ncbi:MAG: M20/M25/M40 family metallo-hydrolase [Gemmatimonadales bacterium]|nr:M20/M25/M40 family metallo-hydrolase [Gemmatimonadales bacterium]
MKNLEYLSDVVGPRLAGSPGMRRSNEWTAERFKSYGLAASLEPFDFGVSWQRGPASGRLLAPFARNVTVQSWAWTAGTGGKPLAGPVVLVNVSSADSVAAYRTRMKGAWIMTGPAANIWNPDGPAMSAADSVALRSRFQNLGRPPADTSAEAVARRRQFQTDLPYLLKQAGALGRLTDGGKEQGLMNMSGSPYSVSPLPNVVIAHEDYAQFARLLRAGVTPRFEATVSNTMSAKPVQQWNTVAEIRGSELPGQVVILGAHLDSWDLGAGTTDNGTGSMVVLEAARIIAQSGLKPKRTIRFILFGAEEEGLLGSAAYAAQHAATADSIQAVLVLDNGTGMVTGQALQGRNQDMQLWKDLLAPVMSLGVKNVREGNKGGTDHLSFIPYGVPGWNFDQESRGYNHTHHSQVDTYDHAVGSDLIQASAVMAVTAWELANLPVLLPRGAKTPVTPRTMAKPSAGLAGK